MRADNAIIMAAGTSSRFAPLSYERPKGLITVRGEVLIERQLRQLREAGVSELYIVTGYKAEQFFYLRDKFGAELIYNGDYLTRNNNASLWYARDVLKNTYVCSADNYFTENPFTEEPDGAYYAAVYADGPTAEWCMEEDEKGFIRSVTVGGANAWYMLGHTFWSRTFSERFLEILAAEYDRPETAGKLWETIFMQHLDTLKMKMRKYAPGVIFEFDTLDELREFDESYRTDARSRIMRQVSRELGVPESALTNLRALPSENTAAAGFSFDCGGRRYRYVYESGLMQPDEQ